MEEYRSCNNCRAKDVCTRRMAAQILLYITLWSCDETDAAQQDHKIGVSCENWGKEADE